MHEAACIGPLAYDRTARYGAFRNVIQVEEQQYFSTARRVVNIDLVEDISPSFSLFLFISHFLSLSLRLMALHGYQFSEDSSTC